MPIPILDVDGVDGVDGADEVDEVDDGDGIDLVAELEQMIDEENGLAEDAEGAAEMGPNSDEVDELETAPGVEVAGDDAVEEVILDDDIPPRAGDAGFDHWLLRATAVHQNTLMTAAVDQCRRGAQSLTDATALAEPWARHVVHPGDISLIVHTGRHEDEDIQHRNVLFVRWESTARHQARVVRLDNRNRVIYNVPFIVPVRTFPAEEVTYIVAKLPVEMLKVTAGSRVPMPGWALLLRDRELARIFPGPQLLETACMMCDLARRTGVDAGVPPTDDKYTCTNCLQAWHSACAVAVAHHKGMPAPNFGEFRCCVCEEAA